MTEHKGTHGGNPAVKKYRSKLASLEYLFSNISEKHFKHSFILPFTPYFMVISGKLLFSVYSNTKTSGVKSIQEEGLK